MLRRTAGAGHPRGERVDLRTRWARFIGRNWARVSYGYRVEPTWLEPTTTRIPVRDLPSPLCGFRIVQLSDFHCSRRVTSDYLAEAVAMAQAAAPDVIVLTGDFVHRGFKYVPHVARALRHLSAPHGVYAVLGNHDFAVRNALGIRRHRHLHRAIATALAAEGITVLHNQAVQLRRRGAALDLVGVADLWSRACDLEGAFAGLDPHLPRVVLAHNPRTVEHLAGRRCDLLLSGHTHGGQINWPGLGRPMLSKRARRFAAGLYECDDTMLYVNRGVGFGLRFRFGVRPEVATLVLERAALG